MKKSTQTAARQVLRTKRPPKLYRPPGSFPFPRVRGKTLADAYLTNKSYLKCVTLCFDDNTELVIDIDPSLSFKANYSDWKNGNQRVIERWPHICSPELPRVMKSSSKARKEGKRPLGLFRGEIWMSPDFDAPLMLVDDPEAKRLVTDKEKRHRLS